MKFVSTVLRVLSVIVTMASVTSALASSAGPPTSADMVVRLATERDLPAISDIYNYYVKTSTATFQTEAETVSDRQKWFEDHDPDVHPVVVCCSSDDDGKIVGWASLSSWNKRQAYDRTTEVSVYVHKDHHRKGIGKSLMVFMVEKARQLGYHVLLGVACTESVGSVKLQEQLGFERVGCFRQVGYKFDRWLDVAYYQLFLNKEAEVSK